MKKNGNYIRIVIHELRTPLTSIKAATDYLLRDSDHNLNEKQVNFLKMIRLNCERLVKITSDFSALNKIENDLEEIKLEPVFVKDFIQSAVYDVEALSSDKKLKVEVNITPKNLKVLTNSFWVKEVIYLILERAVAYSPFEKSIYLEAKAVKNFKGNTSIKGYAEVVITDESSGIETIKGVNVFEKFADIFINGEPPQSKGSGLEFALCREIMKKLKGKIEIKTTPGKGNKYFIYLPLVEIEKK